MADIDRLEIEIEAQARNANRQLDNLISKLDRLSGALGSINTTGLTNLASGVQRFATASQSLKNVKTSDFTRLASNMQKISNVDTGKLYSAASAMEAMQKSLSGMGSIAPSSLQVATIAKDIAKLGGVNVQRAITNLPLLATVLKDFMNSMAGAPKVSSNIINMTNALANLAQQGNKTGAATQSLTSSFNGYSAASARATKSTRSLAAMIGTFYASAFLAIRGIKALGKSIGSSMDFLETVNYFEVAMRDIGNSAAARWRENGYNSAESYAESFSARAKELTAKMTGYEIDIEGNAVYTGTKNLGMDPDKVLQYQATYAQVASSIGVAEESALNFSKALTMLGTDWASLRNLSFDSAWEKFASALAGQSRAVRSLGIDITMATLQEYAYKNGLTEAVSEMNQAEKAQLRLLAILDQSQVAFGDLANTMQSPANQMRMLQQNFSNLARVIGNIFLPVITKVLPYINALVIALQRLFSFIGSLLGIKFESINSSMGGMSDGMADLVGGTEDFGDALDDANKAATKIKNTTLGIDELNVNNPNKGSGSSSGGVGGMGGNPLLDSAIADALADYELKWNDAFDRMENKAQELADKIVGWFKKIWDVAEPTREALKRLWNEGLADLGNFTWDTLKDFYREFLVPVGKWMLGDEAGLPRLINTLNRMLTDVDWGKLRTSLSNLYGALSDLTIIVFDALFDFFDYFLAPLGTWVMSSAIPQMADIITKFIKDVDWERINKALERFWKALEPFAEAIGQGLINFFGDLMSFGAGFINIVVPGGINALAAALEAMDPRTIEKIGYALGIVLTAFLGFKAIKVVNGILKNAWKALYGAEIISGIKKVTGRLTVFADTIPIVTKALTGNKDAANALATFYPKLNSKIISVTDAFSNFKANLNSGAFFKNTLSDLRSWGEGLSTIQKGAITAVAAFAEFSVVQNTFEDLTLGTENLVLGFGKIAIAVAAAGTAMYVALGPAGLAIAAITGVIAGITGIGKAMDQIAENKAMEAVGNALKNPGGTPLTEISSQYETAFSDIARQFDAINQKSSELQTTKKNIDDTKTSIDLFAFGMQNGSQVTAEEVSKITESFQQLVSDSGTLFAQESEIIRLGLMGSLGDAVEAAGYNVSEFNRIISGLQSETQQRLTEIAGSFKELDDQLQNGQITPEQYAASFKPLWEEYKQLSGYTDESKKSIENLQTVISEGIDFSEFVDENGAIKIDDLKNYFTNVADAAADAKGTVEENGQLLIDAIQSMIDQANALGDTEKSSALTNLLNIQKDDIAEQIGEIDRLAGEYTQTIQDGLINKIPEIVNSVEDPDWARKLLGATKEGDIQAALAEFKTSTIDPIEESLQTNFSGIGESGKTYASEAMDNILDGLFDYGNTQSNSRFDSLRKTLTTDVQGAITSGLDDAKAGITTSANSVGKDINEGISNGVTKNLGLVEEAGTSIGEAAIGATRSALDSHSPSQEFISIGGDVVSGFNLGISENTDSTIDTLTVWMDGVKAFFTEEQWLALFGSMPTAFRTKWGELTTWWNEEALPTWWEDSVVPWFTQEKWYTLTLGLKDGIMKRWTEFTTLWKTDFKKWWDLSVEPYFTLEKWNLFGSNMKDGIYSGFEGIVSSVIGLLNRMLSGFENTMNQLISGANAFINDYNSIAGELGGKALSTFSSVSIGLIPQYELGGFPEDGLFMANHKELVGRFSNGRTAVANNDMIVAGIEEAAYRGFARAYAENNQEEELLRELIQAVKEGKSIEIDGRELVAVYDSRKIRNGYSF